MRLLALLSLFPVALSAAASQPDRNLEQAIEHALYRIAPSGSGFIASNPAAHLDVRFSPQGVEFLSGRHHVSLALQNAGPVLHTSVERNRIEYARAGVTEWFVNSPQGIEQGFTIAAPSRRRGPLTVTLATGGDLLPALEGADVVFRGAGSESVLRYGDLTATDATGHALPSRLIVDGKNIRCEIDDRTARYPVTVDPIVRQATLTSLTGGSANGFGVSVAIDGATAVVGSPFWNNNTGAVYVFTQSDSIWTQQAALSPPEAEQGFSFYFGWSVAISGGTIVVGAPLTNNNAGAVYVYTGAGSSWTGLPRITPSDASVSAPPFYDDFGTSVAIDGDTIVVGADGKHFFAGAAYVFSLSGSMLTQQAELTASDAYQTDRLGTSVSISGNTVIAGVPDKGIGMPGRDQGGAAYVFTGSGSTWTQVAALAPSDGVTGDRFGSAVAAVGGGTFVIGAPMKDAQAGAAYVFTPSGGTNSWNQARLQPAASLPLQHFGQAVAARGSAAVIGSSTAGVGYGAVYLFGASAGAWSQLGEFIGPNTIVDWGRAVATDGNTMAFGSASTSAAYLYPLTGVSLDCSNSFDSLVFTANVPGLGPATPTGTVSYTNSTNILATNPLDATGAAVYRTNALTPGTHFITASYSGDANYPPATSNPISVTAASPAASLIPFPDPLPAGTNQVTIGWNAPGHSSLQLVLVNRAEEAVVGTGPSSYSVLAANAAPGQAYQLIDATSLQTLATVDLQPPDSATCSPRRASSFPTLWNSPGVRPRSHPSQSTQACRSPCFRTPNS